MDIKGLGVQIRKVRQERGMTQADIAKALGVSQVTITRLESGSQNIAISKLFKIANALRVPPHKLLSSEPLIPWREKESEIKGHAAEAVAGYKTSPEAYEPVKLFNEMLSLGPGVELSQLVPDDFAPILKKMLPRGFSSPPDRIVAYRTSGISMRPTINDGSIVWIDRLDIAPRQGEIYAFLLPDNSITLKRLIKLQGHRCIIDGDNQDKRDRELEELKPFPLVVDCPEDEEMIIRGRVIWALNRFVEKPAEKTKN